MAELTAIALIKDANEVALRIALEALKCDDKRIMIYISGDDMNISIFTDRDEEEEQECE